MVLYPSWPFLPQPAFLKPKGTSSEQVAAECPAGSSELWIIGDGDLQRSGVKTEKPVYPVFFLTGTLCCPLQTSLPVRVMPTSSEPNTGFSSPRKLTLISSSQGRVKRPATGFGRTPLLRTPHPSLNLPVCPCSLPNSCHELSLDFDCGPVTTEWNTWEGRGTPGDSVLGFCAC